jgi:hypothetical protein
MKCRIAVLLSLFVAASCFAAAPTFKHIIIVVQENRTPDNLFGGNPTFELGVDVQQGASGQWCLGACFSPDHSHPSFEAMWAGGGSNWNNGQHACDVSVHNHCFDHGNTFCNGQVVSPSGTLPLPGCLPKTYVSTTYDNGVIAPYFDIAQKYGFANYFFQTNQGPSFPAHQFLFSGTSAPSGTGANHKFFSSENPTAGSGSSQGGCNSPTNFLVSLIDQQGSETSHSPVRPCFNHASLPTLLDANNISWRYYADKPTSIWNAPNSIIPICKPLSTGDGSCTGFDWVNYVVFGRKQILSDLGADLVHSPCNLKKVSWVIPNGHWSDHPGMKNDETDSTEIEGGPAWVAAIVNTLGTTTCIEPEDGLPYWKDTVVFVVWDDWGGFWDHVNPETAPNLGVQNNCPGWGCGYTHGFRVPFLVVSAYQAAGNGQPGYVSGDTRTPGGGEPAPYIHDFGSLLAFIEYNFLGQTAIGTINPAQNQYPFADGFAPERLQNPNALPLADFFCSVPCTYQPFRQVNIPAGAKTAIDFINDTGSDTDPDNDAIDND